MSASISILVTGSPTQSQAHHSAIRFLNAAIKNGCKIDSVFFYQDAVLVANQFICLPDDETQLSQRWLSLSEQHGFELQVCVAAANRRGIINREEAQLNQKPHESVLKGFSVLGLGLLTASLSKPINRFIHFK